MIVAVDGPTASGKGTIAKALAAHFGLPHLDTGLLYRAVGRQVALSGGDPDDPADAAAACDFPESLLADPGLRGEDAGGLASRVFASGRSFLDSQAQDFDCALVELRMPQLNGFDVLAEWAARGRGSPIVTMSADTEVQSVERALAAGACAHLRKPFDDEELLDAVETALLRG